MTIVSIETEETALLSAAARTRAKRNPLAFAFQSVIYAVTQGSWENAVLKDDTTLPKIHHPTELENAIRTGASQAYYIGHTAALPLALLCSILERTGAAVAVFLESAPQKA